MGRFTRVHCTVRTYCREHPSTCDGPRFILHCLVVYYCQTLCYQKHQWISLLRPMTSDGLRLSYRNSPGREILPVLFLFLQAHQYASPLQIHSSTSPLLPLASGPTCFSVFMARRIPCSLCEYPFQILDHVSLPIFDKVVIVVRRARLPFPSGRLLVGVFYAQALVLLANIAGCALRHGVGIMMHAALCGQVDVYEARNLREVLGGVVLGEETCSCEGLQSLLKGNITECVSSSCGCLEVWLEGL